jgi:hypothetical protein
MTSNYSVARFFIFAMSLFLVAAGTFGLSGFWAYVQEPLENQSGYQCLYIPVFMMLPSVPVALITFVLYMIYKSQVSKAEACLVAVGCAMPVLCLIGFPVAMTW